MAIVWRGAHNYHPPIEDRTCYASARKWWGHGLAQPREGFFAIYTFLEL